MSYLKDLQNSLARGTSLGGRNCRRGKWFGAQAGG